MPSVTPSSSSGGVFSPPLVARTPIRARAGGMVGEGFDTAAAAVPILVDAGRSVLAKGSVD